jgi:hypothetical protein
MKTKRLLISILGSVLVISATPGIAYAVWSATGSGSGAGAATVAQGLVVTPVTPAGANASIYPGGPAGPVFFNIQNPNPYAVTITSLTWSTPLSTNVSSCPSSNVSLDPGAPTTVSISVPANSTASNVQINGVIDLAHAAFNGCQGVAFVAPVTISGTQS